MRPTPAGTPSPADRWQRARARGETRCAQVAAIVHALGVACAHDVDRHLGCGVAVAYSFLAACARRGHLYQVRHCGAGRFAWCPAKSDTSTPPAPAAATATTSTLPSPCDALPDRPPMPP